MSDDFLRDLEGQLRAAAERRRRPVWIPRLVAAAVAVGAIVAALAVAGTPDSERDVTPVGTEPTPAATPSSDCGSVELAEVAPAILEAGGPQAPPGVGRAGERGIALDMAYRVIHEDGVGYWVVPWLRCEHPGLKQDHACFVPMLDEWDDDEEAPRVCATPDELHRDGIAMTFPVDGDTAVGGLAPPLTENVAVRREGELVARLPVVLGAFGGIVERDDAGEVDGYDFEYEGVPRETRPIAVFEDTGLAGGVVSRLHRAGFVGAFDAGEAPRWPDPRIYYLGDAGAEIAREVEEALRLPEGSAIPVPDRIYELAPEALVFVVADAS
jgi:hypothetical protein